MNLSDEGINLIIREETGGKTYWLRRGLNRPTWPGFSSGVTIGCGYDIGYRRAGDVRSDWGEILDAKNIERLVKACGITKDAANALVPTLSDITISWDDALTVFRQATLPRYYLMTLRIYPQAESIPADCATALLSIVFNRGNSLNSSDSEDRRREMRQIREALTQNRLQEIPAYIRSMKRIWPNHKGLKNRRENEAVLFEKGLQTV
jgi:hypothetical protein